MSAENPVSPKVVASTAGAGLGAVLSSFIIWGLGVLIWKEPPTADAVNAAVAAVPAPVSGMILLIISVLGAAIPGYQVKDPTRITPEQRAKLDRLS
jgi:hypothetical protein